MCPGFEPLVIYVIFIIIKVVVQVSVTESIFMVSKFDMNLKKI